MEIRRSAGRESCDKGRRAGLIVIGLMGASGSRNGEIEPNREQNGANQIQMDRCYQLTRNAGSEQQDKNSCLNRYHRTEWRQRNDSVKDRRYSHQSEGLHGARVAYLSASCTWIYREANQARTWSATTSFWATTVSWFFDRILIDVRSRAIHWLSLGSISCTPSALVPTQSAHRVHAARAQCGQIACDQGCAG